jgi:LPXTG-site transpeptidase (sortase) family protein
MDLGLNHLAPGLDRTGVVVKVWSMTRQKRTATVGSILVLLGSCLLAAVVATYVYVRLEAWAQAQPRSLASQKMVWFEVPPMTPLPSPTITPLPTPTPTPTPTPGPPVHIEIPRIGVTRAVVPVGLTVRNGQLEWDAASLFATSGRRDLVGHLDGTTNPGQVGNIVLIGHNYNRGAYNWLGAFYSIHRLKEGDVIHLLNEENEIFSYRVEQVEKVPWQSRASSSTLKHIAYLSPTQDETLTLVTCGGANFAPFPSRIYVTAKRLSENR